MNFNEFIVIAPRLRNFYPSMETDWEKFRRNLNNFQLKLREEKCKVDLIFLLLFPTHLSQWFSNCVPRHTRKFTVCVAKTVLIQTVKIFLFKLSKIFFLKRVRKTGWCVATQKGLNNTIFEHPEKLN